MGSWAVVSVCGSPAGVEDQHRLPHGCVTCKCVPMNPLDFMEQDGLEPNDLKCRHHLSFSMAPSFFVILVYVNSHFLFILWCLCTQSLLLEFFPSH